MLMVYGEIEKQKWIRNFQLYISILWLIRMFLPLTYRKNMAVVHLFFTESRFMNYYKSELFGFT